MQIDSLEVKLKDGGSDDHPDALGHEMPPNGSLVILYGVPDIDEQGNIGKRAYPAVIYAPGTWERLYTHGARGTGLRVATPPTVAKVH